MKTNVTLLWHDDELVDARRDYVAPWLRWFDRESQSLGLTVVRTSTLRELAESLQSQQAPPDVLMLDVMLKREPDSTFEKLGFAKEGLLRLDAGAQIVGLIRNAAFDAGRPSWLKRYRDTPIVLLSSSPTVDDLIKHYVNADRKQWLWGVTKDIDASSGEARPDPRFVLTIREALKRARSSDAASTTQQP